MSTLPEISTYTTCGGCLICVFGFRLVFVSHRNLAMEPSASRVHTEPGVRNSMFSATDIMILLGLIGGAVNLIY
uniref:Uncharacterized protein n=1 Tax=Myoviridae sp. ctu2j3 TaxID=2825197 RepID=A0A8S5UHZ8_9CAUD|nr:MAG TPA: hypothetical protein [Myoviridae sp. ctu2j3]DAF94294.1 MAG TPA: hypothetical protein [Myoviridae sp. ctu2j3]